MHSNDNHNPNKIFISREIKRDICSITWLNIYLSHIRHTDHLSVFRVFWNIPFVLQDLLTTRT